MIHVNKEIVREEIHILMEAIREQYEAIRTYEKKIPQIEFDIIMENIRKLYEDFHMLRRLEDPYLIFEGKLQEQDDYITPSRKNKHEGKQEFSPEKSKEREPAVRIHYIKPDPEPAEKVAEQPAEKYRDFKTSISINDKFLIINELFGGNLREYTETIETLNGMKEEVKSTEYLELLGLKNEWDTGSASFLRLKELAAKRFRS